MFDRYGTARTDPRGRRTVTTVPRDELARRIAGEITLSDDPGATLRKWRTDFDVSQTALAGQLDVSSSVISDYESGRRESPGIGVVRRMVEALLDIDESRGGERIRRYARVISAGFESDIVQDLREYSTSMPLERLYETMDATELVRGDHDEISGHTVINSIEAITRLSSEEFYRLYGQSTSRALIFTGVTRGESPLVALRVVNPTPHAVVLHGLDEEDLWEHAPSLATIDGFSLAIANRDLDDTLEDLRKLP
ncbi:putative transcriptional regulator [Halopelagius inordinatus]|uniref:Putative transcriptional regulator n=1 Tax=Halopelagius inordinatus TaxID=553467 RepID=A0A1I2S1U1_9EURY|nr:putative transcriptional regulator [Halopelagius inordinatus]